MSVYTPRISIHGIGVLSITAMHMTSMYIPIGVHEYVALELCGSMEKQWIWVELYATHDDGRDEVSHELYGDPWRSYGSSVELYVSVSMR